MKTAKHTFQIVFLTMFLGGCASTIPEPHQPSEAHISVNEEVTVSGSPSSDIPEIVQKKAFLPPPVPQPTEQDLERYTVVVNDVPVKELLFALARDASLNIDVDSDIEGYVTLNAVEQTLPQILERISRQAGLRYELKGNNLYISPDDPYFRTYTIDYVNIDRDSEGSISIATQIATTGTVDVTSNSTGGGSSSSSGSGSNDSTTKVSSYSKHHFWQTLTNNIQGLLGESVSDGQNNSQSVVVNSESGVISVRATSAQHLAIQEFIDQVMVNVQRQVLIEATIVEVTLSNRFQAGVDWSAVIGGNILTLNQNLLSGALPDDGRFFSGVLQADNGDPDFRATLRLLKTFGDVKVLSSPKLMALNNQTAVLKVVDNFVYFTIDSEISQSTNLTGGNLQSIESEIHTVPVGLVMSVTPQINQNSAVTMNVRPTISRISDFTNDPGPRLFAQQNGGDPTAAVFQNLIPVISVREMESILKVNSGQVAVLGGLMQDNYQRDTNGIPGLGDIPEVGNAFKQRDFQNTKSELIIFLRPVVINNASLTGDLAPYRQYLQNNVTTPLPVPK